MKLFQLKLNYSHIKKNHKSYYLMYVYTYYCLGFLLWYRIVIFLYMPRTSVPIDVVLCSKLWTMDFYHHNFIYNQDKRKYRKQLQVTKTKI